MGVSIWISVAALAVSIVSAAVSLFAARMQFRCDAALRIKKGWKRLPGGKLAVMLELVADSRSDTRVLWVKGVKGTTLHSFRYGTSPSGQLELEVGERVERSLSGESVERAAVHAMRVVAVPADGAVTLSAVVTCDRLFWRVKLTAMAKVATD